MSRQTMKRRPKQGITRGVQGRAGQLNELREEYLRLGPGHPDFERILGEAATTAGVIEGSMRAMSRPNGLSRRTASARFLAVHALADTSEDRRPDASQQAQEPGGQEGAGTFEDTVVSFEDELVA